GQVENSPTGLSHIIRGNKTAFDPCTDTMQLMGDEPRIAAPIAFAAASGIKNGGNGIAMLCSVPYGCRTKNRSSYSICCCFRCKVWWQWNSYALFCPLWL
ncbi:hypothetical protein PoB_001781600, partial [Plakobranchus ocellatus]